MDESKYTFYLYTGFGIVLALVAYLGVMACVLYVKHRKRSIAKQAAFKDITKVVTSLDKKLEEISSDEPDNVETDKSKMPIQYRKSETSWVLNESAPLFYSDELAKLLVPKLTDLNKVLSDLRDKDLHHKEFEILIDSLKHQEKAKNAAFLGSLLQYAMPLNMGATSLSWIAATFLNKLYMQKERTNDPEVKSKLEALEREYDFFIQTQLRVKTEK